MAQLDSVSIKHIDISNSKRFLLLLPFLFFIVSAIFIFRWGMGSAVAEQSSSLELVQLAQRWSPHDAQTQMAEAGIWLNSRVAGDEKKVVTALERAVSLSPNDYRFWMSLGLARERVDDISGSEKAMRQAIKLAPFYAIPRWQLGNLLLRQGRLDEAFAELRVAGEAMKILRPQIVSIAWSVYGNVTITGKALGDSSALKAELAKYLAQQDKLDDALKIWNTLSIDERREEENIGKEIFIAAMKANRLRIAWNLAQGFNSDEFPKSAVDEILNPGFEGNILPAGTSYFGWQISVGEQPLIAIDASHAKEGTRSLLINFASAGGFEFRNVSQLLIVEPSSSYSLEYFFKTSDMKAVGAVKIEVVDVSNNQTLIGTSKTIPDGTNDWQYIKIEFKTDKNTEAIAIRLARDRCSDNNCPIFGKVWYDDFKLRRTNN